MAGLCEGGNEPSGSLKAIYEVNILSDKEHRLYEADLSWEYGLITSTVSNVLKNKDEILSTGTFGIK
ncbi:hypothetical protein ANN_07757 [Periplaneta americana]|uniref:Uncharacterized protein n=1 Tax=Periplaneta americana TaxID=6978 RepID=A0ABQ8SZG8_PERAM|nr:hypothetical protein ANN_07757 [Periplaneta americana]